MTVLRDGRKVATLRPGSWFGEIAVFKWTRRTATCIASNERREGGSRGSSTTPPPTEVLSLSSKAFTELSTEHPWLQLAMADLCHQRTGDMLSCISFFKNVPKVQLELLGALFSYRSVKTNTIVCHEGKEIFKPTLPDIISPFDRPLTYNFCFLYRLLSVQIC